MEATQVRHGSHRFSPFLVGFIITAVCMNVALAQVCTPPNLGSSYVSTACQSLTRCQTCSVTCAPGTAGQSTTLQCLGEEDDLRNFTTFNTTFSSWLEYSVASCDASGGSDPVSLAYASRCGLEPCCPLEPTRPSSCTNRMDDEFRSPGQCVMLINEYGRTCEVDFCPTCGAMAGYCDFTCGYGACAVCGDCWRGSALSAGITGECDDGNSVDGDGCSSSCRTEPGFTCKKGDGAAPDSCEMCVDMENWTDAQGYSCEDYRVLEACDATTHSTDPVTPGGGEFQTPNYHHYKFVYDLALTDQKPMILYVEVQAENDAHIFLGRPPGTPAVNLPEIGVHGFEIIIGGWNNGMSQIRRYPGRQELSTTYGSRLNASEVRHFWIYCSSNGTLLVGEGKNLFQNRFLGGERSGIVPSHGSGIITMDAQLAGWYYPVDQVSIATGWGSAGSWSLRLADGSSTATIGSLATGGLDASMACCACGGGSSGRKCELEDRSIAGPALPRLDVPTTARRLNHGGPHSIKSFSGDLMLLGAPSADGFLLRVPVADTCEYSGPGAVDCYINAIVVPAQVASHVFLPLTAVWAQTRSSSCRLRRLKLARQAYSRWAASGCNFKAGSSYALFVHVEPGTELKSLQFTVPYPPGAAPKSMTFVDADPMPNFVAGLVVLQGANNEDGILQYRLYWGRSASEKVTSRDHRSALVNVVNTYADGGFRNGFSNFCLYGDCQWKAEKAGSHRRRGLYRIRHQGMGFCFCQSAATKALEQIACPVEVMSFDHPQAFSHGECLWLHTDVIVNRAKALGQAAVNVLETRMKNVRFFECVCQVPAQSGSSSDGYELPELRGEASVSVVTGKWCDVSRFNYKIDDEPVLTSGYCEWTVMPSDPTPTAALKVDAASTTANSAVSQHGSVTKHSSWGGVPVWHLASDGRLGLTTPRVVGSHYTLAMWVNLRRLAQASGGQGSRTLFAARSSTTGDAEPCLMVQQRYRIDDRPPRCAMPECNGTQVDLCCGPTTTTMTTTTASFTTSSTSTAGNDTNDSNASDDSTSNQDETSESGVDCNCMCPEYNQSSLIGDYLSGDQWALGFQACGSQVMWDSGFDLTISTAQDPGWVLIAAVGDSTASSQGETVFYMSKPEEPETITQESEFGCASAGCTATATIRDVGRDLQRTCALSVRVRITDYGDGLERLNPEVVESVVVTAGHPQRTITIRQNCHPDGENDHQRNFTCVDKFDIDDIVGGATASRAMRIDIKISAAVDEHPMPNGDLLSGVASVVCKRVVPLDKNAPPSGGLRKVGIAGHTCAGSHLEAIGGAADGTNNGLEAYLGQAWHFDRSLPEDDVKALFYATRTRYYQDYQLNLENMEVVQSSLEARVTGRVRCRKRGCEGSTVLKGLPTAQTSTCLLTVGVSMTDFSNDKEFIEYIRIDGIDVVTNCQIGSDNTGEQWGYLCADNLDVSQQVLKSAYLNDGEIKVTAKITDEVDKYRTWENDLLDAMVTVHCFGAHMEDSKKDWGAVSLAPQTGHLIAVSANINGESSPIGTKLDDRVNGFIKEPSLLGPVSTGAAALKIEPTDPDGDIYTYAVRREDRGLVTRQGIVDGLADLDICPNSHRRRGPILLLYWRQDSVMSNCLFEPQVPYTLVLYVDTSNAQMLKGGGTIGFMDIVGATPTISGAYGEQWRPILRPQKVQFVDQDNTVAVVQGTVTITRAYSEVGITNYYLYFGRDTRHLDLGGLAPTRLANVQATGADTYTTYIHQTIPNGATHLIVFAVNELSYPWISRSCREAVILDNSIAFLQTPTLMQAPGNKELNRFRVAVQLSTPSVRVDIALVKKGAELNARPGQNARALDFRAMQEDTVCIAENKMSDLATDHFDFGTCDVVPNTDYVIVVYASIRIECPCRDPCKCDGALTTVVEAASASELIHTSYGGFRQPDIAPPIATVECDSCAGDRVVRPTVVMQDLGHSFPVLAFCFACVKTTPAACVRHGDSQEHRYWRLRMKNWTWCKNIDIHKLEFMELSVLTPTGDKVNGTAISGAAQIAKATPTPTQNAFDDSETTFYTMGAVMEGCYRDVPNDRDLDHYKGIRTWKECAEQCKDYAYFGRQGARQCWCGAAFGKHGPQSLNDPCNCDPEATDIGAERNCIYNTQLSYSVDTWVGLDLGPQQKLAVSFVNIKWRQGITGTCPHRPWNEKATLEWSDDGYTWHLKLEQLMPVDNSLPKSETFMYPSPKTRTSDFDGSFYQSVFLGEGKNEVALYGLTPKTTYKFECFVQDAAGNSGWGTAGDITTMDTTGPFMRISGFSSVSDFAVQPMVHIKDPGKSYPALVKCFAREHVPGDPPPKLEIMSGKGQLCRAIHAPASQTREGRVEYIHVLSSWLTHQDRRIVFSQKVFGYTPNDVRMETKSCGLRHDPRNGIGGCGTETSGVKQAARFVVAVKAYRDAHIYLGRMEREAVGYEIIFGGWSNKKSAIRRGFSADRINNDLKYGTIIAEYGTGDDVLSNMHGLVVRHFWVSADPNTGIIEVGEGEIFDHKVIMSYKDDDMPLDIDNVWAGAGYYSGGSGGFYGADFYICPKIGNMAMHRPAYSHSVAFGGTPDKAFDGQSGDGIFCEYCVQADPRHVCAQTRKGSQFIPPWIKVDLGSDRTVRSVRVVGPQPGEVLPAQTTVTIYAGRGGDRSDNVCRELVDITGDNIWDCFEEDGNNARWVSLYGQLDLMKDMPEVQGIRVCEVEVYEKFIENDEMYKAQLRYQRTTGMPDPASPPSSLLTLGGLEPNTDYEVFCYGEDEYGSGGISDPAYIKTTDITPPTLKIASLVAGDYEIRVNVDLRDPGKSYPALARCAATDGGVIPQGHERHFEHRFWRIILPTPKDTLEEDCEGDLLVRAVSLHAHGGATLPGLTYSSAGPTARGSAMFTDTYTTDPVKLFEDANELAWQLPPGEPWIGFDMEARRDYESYLMRKGASLEGDLVVSASWSAPYNESGTHLMLYVITPDGVEHTRENPKVKTGYMDLSMQCENFREPLRMVYKGRKATCSGTTMETFLGKEGNGASVEECKARCLDKPECSGFQLSHYPPDVGSCYLYHGTLAITTDDQAFTKHMCYKKEGTETVYYTKEYTTQFCDDGALMSLGGRRGGVAEGVLASRTACETVCTESPECQFYLWRDDPSVQTRYHCEFWASCNTRSAYSFNLFRSSGTDAHIYKKHVQATLFEARYYKTGPNHYCPDGQDVTDQAECYNALPLLKDTYGMVPSNTVWNGSYELLLGHRYCVHETTSSESKVRFNSVGDEAAKTAAERLNLDPSSTYESICKVVPLPPDNCCQAALTPYNTRQTKVCDWQCYLDRYPDIQALYGHTNVAAAETHYYQIGWGEGRDCTCLEFLQCDWQCYLTRYPDVEALVNKNNFKGAKRHYEMIGRAEGKDCTCPDSLDIEYRTVRSGICEDHGFTTVTDEDHCVEAIRSLRGNPLLERPWPDAGGIIQTGTMNERIPRGCNMESTDLSKAGYYPTAYGGCGGAFDWTCICIYRKGKVCNREEYVESSIFAFSQPGVYDTFVRKMTDIPKEPPTMQFVGASGFYCEGTGPGGFSLTGISVDDCKAHCISIVDCVGFAFRNTGLQWYCDLFTGTFYQRPIMSGEVYRECYEKVQEDKEIETGKAYVKLCGKVYEFELNMTADEENVTIGRFEVPYRGCSRSDRGPDLKSWQISTRPEGPEYGAPLKIADLALDGDNTTCAQTGGEGRSPGVSEDAAWWRTDLGGLVHVEAIWLAGDHLSGTGAGARFVDVFVVEPQVTDVSDLYLYPLVVSGRQCDMDDGAVRLKEELGLTLKKCQSKCSAHAECHYLSYREAGGSFCNLYKVCGVPKTVSGGWDTYERKAAEDKLCASNVVVGSAEEDFTAPPLTVTSCVKSMLGSHVWVFARDETRGLTFCEVEVYTTPLHVASMARFQWGSPPNGSLAVCGAQNATIEWSDDNETWHKEWDMQAEHRLNLPQSGSWEWWSQLFALNFTATFDDAGVQPVIIDTLRPNSTYDVFCWAVDALGNDISRELVTLLRPWGQTMDAARTDMGYEGPPLPWRRLLEGRGEGMKFDKFGGMQCTPELRELIPCEERITTMDRKPPAVISFTLTRTEEAGLDSNMVAIQKAFVEMVLSDTSCENRQIRAVKCSARCQVRNLVDGPGPWEIEDCALPRCLERRWSNEEAVQFVFNPVYPGSSYALMCEMSDPWGNTHRKRFEMHVSDTTTMAPTPSPRPTSPPSEEKEEDEKKDEKEEPKPESQNWRAPSPSQDYDDDDGWIAIGDFTTTSTTVNAIPRTTSTAPPARTTSWLGAQQAQPPTTSTEQLYVLPGEGAAGTPPPPVQIMLSLGATSEADAQMLLRPSSIYALVSALRQSLGLSADDTLDVQAAKIFAPQGRRLASPGRQLNQTGVQVWEVRLRIHMQMVGQAHAATVNARLREIRDGTGNRRELLAKTFRSELAARNVPVTETAVLGATLQEHTVAMAEGSGPDTGKATAGVDASSQGGGAVTSAGKDMTESSSNSTTWVIIGIVTVGLLLVLVPAGVVCAWWMWHRQQDGTKQVGRRPVATGATAKGHRTSGGRRKGNAGEQTSRPASLQKLPVQAPTQRDGPVSPCKIAWASADEERLDTPGSSVSTASTRQSTGHNMSSSTGSGASSTRTQTPGSEQDSIIGELPGVKPAVRNALLDEAVEVESCTSANTFELPASDPGDVALVVNPAQTALDPSTFAHSRATTPAARPGPANRTQPVAMAPAAGAIARAHAAAAAANSSRIGASRFAEPAPAPPDTSGVPVLARGHRQQAGGGRAGQAGMYGTAVATTAAVHWRGQAATRSLSGSAAGSPVRSAAGSHRGAAHQGAGAAGLRPGSHRSSSGPRTPPLLQ